MIQVRDRVVLRRVAVAGEVVEVDGQRARVAWDDGLTTSIRADALRVESVDPEWAHVAVMADVAAERDRARALAARLEAESAEFVELHWVRVVLEEGGFRGVCSCGWRMQFGPVRDARDAAAGAAVHGLAVW